MVEEERRRYKAGAQMSLVILFILYSHFVADVGTTIKCPHVTPFSPRCHTVTTRMDSSLPPPETVLDPQSLFLPLSDNELDYDSDTPPTAVQWNNMKRYGSFISVFASFYLVSSSHPFKLTMNRMKNTPSALTTCAYFPNSSPFASTPPPRVYVLPSGKSPDEDIDRKDLWLAQIRSIRAFNAHNVSIRFSLFLAFSIFLPRFGSEPNGSTTLASSQNESMAPSRTCSPSPCPTN